MECKECGYSCDTEMVGEHHYKKLQAENERLKKKNERLADAVERLQRSKTS